MQATQTYPNLKILKYFANIYSHQNFSWWTWWISLSLQQLWESPYDNDGVRKVDPYVWVGYHLTKFSSLSLHNKPTVGSWPPTTARFHVGHPNFTVKHRAHKDSFVSPFFFYPHSGVIEFLPLFTETTAKSDSFLYNTFLRSLFRSISQSINVSSILFLREGSEFLTVGGDSGVCKIRLWEPVKS